MIWRFTVYCLLIDIEISKNSKSAFTMARFFRDQKREMGRFEDSPEDIQYYALSLLHSISCVASKKLNQFIVIQEVEDKIRRMLDAVRCSGQ